MDWLDHYIRCAIEGYLQDTQYANEANSLTTTMPKFKYTDLNCDLPAVGIYLAQITKAEKRISKNSGSDMIALSLRTIPDGYSLRYFLVFNGKKSGDGARYTILQEL